MASTAMTISMSFTALLFSGLAMWRADSHAASRAAPPAVPVTPVPVHAAPPAPAQHVAPVARVALSAPVRGLAVHRLVVGTGVEAREATGHAAEYELTRGQRFCAVVEVTNAGAPGALRVRFEPDGNAGLSVGHVRLAVPSSPHYRTWGCTGRIQAPGTWSAVVETRDGAELAREVFTVR